MSEKEFLRKMNDVAVGITVSLGTLKIGIMDRVSRRELDILEDAVKEIWEMKRSSCGV